MSEKEFSIPEGDNKSKKKYFLDRYLRMDPSGRKIEFIAPASEVFKAHENKEESTKKWLDRY